MRYASDTESKVLAVSSFIVRRSEIRDLGCKPRVVVSRFVDNAREWLCRSLSSCIVRSSVQHAGLIGRAEYSSSSHDRVSYQLKVAMESLWAVLSYRS